MDKFQTELISMKDELEEKCRILEKKMEMYPPGGLRIDSCGKTVQFYHLPGKEVEGAKHNGHYLKKEDQGLAVMLAQKDYERKLYAKIKAQIKWLDRIIKTYPGDELDQVYMNLSDVRQSLVTPLYLSDDKYIEQWKNVNYEKKPFKEGDPEYFTDSGVRVRSKSEILMGNRFDHYHIPWRYEYPVRMDGNKIFHPDFTLLNIRTREEVYWEHCGKMHDQDYCDDMIYRNVVYARNGIIQGKNLLYTFENSRTPVNMKTVEALIKEHLL